MINNIKNKFNIKDLENLTGIKAHTIRIWEKRYNILEPERTDTNIRFYDIASLQKLLNISTLNSFGYKISALAKMPEEKIPVLVKEVITSKNLDNHILNNFKLAMMNFDQPLFLNTYNSLLQEKSFREIFYEFFIPLLNEIGYLWQTNTITPAHEHFMSFLIKQKLASNIEKLLTQPSYKSDKIFVLYLPENEIHELGLMFINYELSLNGYRCIYLGESVPVENLKDVKNYFDNITFVTYITVEPGAEEINNYISSLEDSLLDNNTNLYIFGRNTQYITSTNSRIKTYISIKDFAETL